MKTSGKMKNKLPFELPCEDDDSMSSPSPLKEGSQGTIHLSNEEIAHMEEIYKIQVPEFKSLFTIYEMEKGLARKQGKIKKFPSFTNWKPEGSQVLSAVHFSILQGLQRTAVVYHQYALEAKQHSRSNLYISTQHPSKKPTIVFYRALSDSSSSYSSTASATSSFGIIDKIYLHSFAQTVFVWAVMRLYKASKFIKSCGLWCSDGSFGKTVPVLLSDLSHPLTTTADEKGQIWFLDAYW